MLQETNPLPFPSPLAFRLRHQSNAIKAGHLPWPPQTTTYYNRAFVLTHKDTEPLFSEGRGRGSGRNERRDAETQSSAGLSSLYVQRNGIK